MDVGVEIERKFLVRGTPWEGHEGVPYLQGYLAERDGVVVRIRRAGPKGILTIKGPAVGLARPEFEYAVPLDEVEGMLALCGGRVVRKTRYRVPVGHHVWEVDVFEGANAPLVMAEVELSAEDEAFVRPDWIAQEVSDDSRYTNARLAESPYGSWGTR